MSDCPLCHAAARRWDEQPAATWWRCPSCGLFFVDPRPDEATLGRLYRGSYYAGETDESERSQRIWRQRVQLLGEVARGGTVLDVGCGRGPFVAAARARGWRAWGSEVDRHAGAAIPAELRHWCLVCDLCHAPFAPGTLDVVTLFDVIEHVRRPVEFLRAAGELLRPGGVVVITTPNAACLKARLRRQRWKYFRFEHYLHLYHFTPTTLATAVEQAGLEMHTWFGRRGMPLFVAAAKP